jgi:plasmid maintenance system antidote protein VapI
LCTYSSVTNAANELGVAPSLITAVIHGRSKSSRGFFFRYQGSKALPLKRKGRKVVEQLCLKTGRVIAVHTTIKEAAVATGITSPGISFCCNGRNGSKSAGGFGWRFAVVHPGPR